MLGEGIVTADGKVVTKPSFDAADDCVLAIVGETLRYVSRGGLKLERALDAFSLDVTGLSCIDIGASTGGFTDCLLQHGAASVRAVDVGRAQLHESIAADPRVTSFEGVNARYLKPEDIGGTCQLAVCDVSFISLTLLFSAVRGLIEPEGRFVALIKPQFEAGRQNIGKGGIVKDKAVHEAVIRRVLESASACGLHCFGLCASPIAGGDGNREYLAGFDGIGGFSPESIRHIVFDT